MMKRAAAFSLSWHCLRKWAKLVRMPWLTSTHRRLCYLVSAAKRSGMVEGLPHRLLLGLLHYRLQCMLGGMQHLQSLLGMLHRLKSQLREQHFASSVVRRSRR